jgi:hypothetical protein
MLPDLHRTIADRFSRLDGPMPAGEHAARFDASGLPFGVCVVRIRMGEFTAARLMTVVK